MTQNEKDLLLQDLSARLPYGVKGQYLNSDDPLLKAVTISYGSLDKLNGMVMDGSLVPWLFPLSSMTEEQRVEAFALLNNCDYYTIDSTIKWLDNHPIKFFDWCNKNHFDYRDLIEKSLALDATGLNIY